MCFQTETATFIMPHWTLDIRVSMEVLQEAIRGIVQQTDDNWNIVIFDDASPCPHAKECLLEIERQHKGRIHLLFNEVNQGHGQTRNKAIRYAQERGAPFLLFNDADDISHPRRLEVVRRIFNESEEADVVYSSFKIIDEHGKDVEFEQLTESIREILEGHRQKPVQGSNTWIDMGLHKGYTNLTSSTAVRTALALEYPFPNEAVSEDYYTWLCYAAGGGEYVYSPDIPSSYRIPQFTGSASRARIKDYYKIKAEVDEKGFRQALSIAIAKKKISSDPKLHQELLVKFYIRLSETMRRENETELASQQLAKAALIQASDIN